MQRQTLGALSRGRGVAGAEGAGHLAGAFLGDVGRRPRLVIEGAERAAESVTELCTSEDRLNTDRSFAMHPRVQRALCNTEPSCSSYVRAALFGDRANKTTCNKLPLFVRPRRSLSGGVWRRCATFGGHGETTPRLSSHCAPAPAASTKRDRSVSPGRPSAPDSCGGSAPYRPAPVERAGSERSRSARHGAPGRPCSRKPWPERRKRGIASEGYRLHLRKLASMQKRHVLASAQGS